MIRIAHLFFNCQSSVLAGDIAFEHDDGQELFDGGEDRTDGDKCKKTFHFGSSIRPDAILAGYMVVKHAASLRKGNITSMRKYYILLMGLILTLLPASGCQTNTSHQSVEAIGGTKTSTSTPSYSPEVTIAPSGPPNPTAIVFDTGPVLPLSFVDDFLFQNAPADCQLPCWQNLRVGASQPNEIQHMFDTVFGFNGSVDFFNSQPSHGQIWVSEYPSTYTTGYLWTMNQGAFFFSIELVLDELGNTLQGIRFSSNYSPYTLKEIMRQLGAPDKIWVSAAPTLPGETGKRTLVVRFLLVYQEGLAFLYSRGYPIEESVQSIEYCLDETPPSITAYILPSIVDFSGDNAHLLQNEWIFGYITRQSLAPIEERLNISINEFSELALGPAPCLKIAR